MPSLARSVPKPLKVPSLSRSVPKAFKMGQEGEGGSNLNINPFEKELEQNFFHKNVQD